MISQDPAEIFRQEARELVEQLEHGLLDLGQTPEDRDLVDSVFRALHTIKGSGAMFGFTDVADFVHEFETAFDRVRKGDAIATGPLITVALRGKDHVQKLIEGEPTDPMEGEEILATLRLNVTNDAGTLKDPVTADLSPAGAANHATSSVGWHIRFRLPAEALAFGASPLLLLEELGELGTCHTRAAIGDVPDLTELDPEVSYLAWDVKLTTDAPRSMIDDIFMFLQDGMDLSIEPIVAPNTAAEPEPVVARRPEPAPQPAIAEPVQRAAPPPPKAAAAKPRGAEAKAAATDAASLSLRVPAERLDELMDRVGQLVIAQARLTQLAGPSGDANLKSIAEELERLSSGLRDTTMGIRMVPIGQLFGRFRRLVHDLSRDLNKEIDFITTGEATELDKTMIERLADPLVHIIRNALDHGLETTENRAAIGKPTLGTIRLAAVHSGAEVAISVSDDGAGLNADRIRAKAIENGLIGPDAKLSESEINHLIFQPGFSTAEVVSTLSGRGVGMDVVKRTIDGLRGSIEVATTLGEGTTVTLRLPLTLAIIDGLLVRVGDGRYTIPLSAVEECLELPKMAEVTDSGCNFIDVRGSLVPFLRLRELFRTPEAPDEFQKIVIVASGSTRVGLVVDQIIGSNQAVIKQLSKLHSDLKTFSGATILGDGTVALILDAMNLVNFGQAYEQRHIAESNGKAA